LVPRLDRVGENAMQDKQAIIDTLNGVISQRLS
jgi:hypothetical protein